MELNALIICLKFRKVPGRDSITIEHIIHGGKSLMTCLANINNAIVSCDKIPLLWERGIIVPLYKGGSKPIRHVTVIDPLTYCPAFLKFLKKKYSVPHF
jgi:hypothetical protein